MGVYGSITVCTIQYNANFSAAAKVIKNWIVVQVYQGLTRDYLSDRNDVYPAGVNFDPRSGSLVVNGLPGHLQFYSLKQDAMLYNVSNTGATIYPIQVM